MRAFAALLLALALGACAARAPAPTSAADLPQLSCVPFARQLSGIALSGDAWSWWRAADGRYARSRTPSPGAVLVLARSTRLPRGHLAVVLRQPDPRRIEVAHANWGAGTDKGRVESFVPVVDVSPGNDWSLVRVFHAPTGGLGSTSFAAHGFVLPPRSADPAELGAAIRPAAFRAAAYR